MKIGDKAGQCTKWAYDRAIEIHDSAPCWQTGCGSNGSGLYNHAKTWTEHYRDPWEVKDVGFLPSRGDVIVWDGNYGHVAVIEDVYDDGTARVSMSNMDGDQRYSEIAHWPLGTRIDKSYGYKYTTGVVKGYLHYPAGDDLKAQLTEIRNQLNKIIKKL